MKKETAEEKAFDKMARAIGEYIKAMGGSAVVVGGTSIEQHEKFKYTLRVDVTGKPPTQRNL